jgi:hypothetical protein
VRRVAPEHARAFALTTALATALALVVDAVGTRAAAAQATRADVPRVRWSIELAGGTAVSAPTPLTIRQRGAPDVRLTARYDTRPWHASPYYAYRVARWAGARAWEAELVHHKLYLHDPPTEVQHFEVSHGYNLITLNHARRAGSRVTRVGVGVVVVRPESTIRGRAGPPGYHVGGVTAQLAAARRVALGRGWLASIEGKGTASYARAPIAGGSAAVPNAALHVLLGVGKAF